MRPREGLVFRIQINATANSSIRAWEPQVAALDWETPALVSWENVIQMWAQQSDLLHHSDGRFVLCSDVVYEPSAYKPLLETLLHLTAPTKEESTKCQPATRVIMAHRSRHPDEGQFWDAAARSFRIQVVEGARFRPLGSSLDIKGATEVPTLDDQEGAIRVLELYRRSTSCDPNIIW